MASSAPDVEQLAAAIERDLRAVATPERAAGEKQYLKSELEFLGATLPAIRKITAGVQRAHPDLSRTRMVALARRLWKPGIFELRMAGIDILDRFQPQLTLAEWPLLERFVREAKTWALVDPLAISVIGGLVERAPEAASRLDRWATDDDFWIRRSALLALLKPLRAGEGDFARFARYADAMLEEKEFFIRKAIGWVLRDMSRSAPDRVAEWVAPRTQRMSGVTIREAVKHLPPQVAEAYMAAYREKRPAT